MIIFDWVVAIIIILSLIYISFVLTLADWLAALRKGEAVSLLPERGGRKYPFSTQVIMLIIGFALLAVLLYFLWIPLFPIPAGISLAMDIIGLVFYVGGFAFVLWARRTLGKMWAISTSNNVKLREDHQLIRSGPYAFVRNPMYFGWWATMFGLVLLYPVWMVAILFLFSVVSFIGRARREDRALSERFGES